MPNRLIYTAKTREGEKVTLYPPKLHTFEQISNYLSFICKQVEKGLISESQAATIKDLLSIAIEIVRRKKEFEKYDEVLAFKEREEEE